LSAQQSGILRSPEQSLAAGCGYFDQAHFIHDFKEFSGINPTTYLTRKTEHLNQVPMHE
jgi:AraC-like DNA-binding protein